MEFLGNSIDVPSMDLFFFFFGAAKLKQLPS